MVNKNTKMMRELTRKMESDPILTMFVIGGLDKYAELVLADKAENWSRSMFHKPAFDERARQVKAMIDNHLSDKKGA